MSYRTLNPATGELVEEFPQATPAQVETALDSAGSAFERWRRTTLEERSRLLVEAAELLNSRTDQLARLMAVEMGKPLEEGRAEAAKCAWGCRHFAENAARALSDEKRTSDGSKAFVRPEPLGPILAIMPWNFPFWQFYRFAAPALMAGNTVVLKHAPNTPRCALAIESVMQEAGFPSGVVQSLFLDNDQAASVIADRRVRGVTLTGSTRAGSAVAAIAGRHLKTMVLELGGSDPFIVLEDADVDEAARVGVVSRCLNSGQSCIAAKRFLVHRSRYDEFADRLVQGMLARVMGDPTVPDVDLGPLAREDLRERLARQVTDSLSAGAEAKCGAAVPAGNGFFYPPTVLSGVTAGMPAAEEELFGPVAVLVSFRTEKEALELANATRYGLGASVWTTDPDRARRIVADLEAGNVFVNGLVKSDPRLPFGGVKDSGFGRELSREGVLAFVNVKTVWIK